MKCNIIRDLLPSYIDGICSKETTQAVEKHVAHCEQCQHYLQMMQQPMNPLPPLREEMTVAKEPFKRINKKRRIQILAAVAITFIVMIIGALVVQEVGAVRQIFFPQASALAITPNDLEEWQTLKFNDQQFFEFNSVFWDKKIINVANNEKEVIIRVKDKDGNIIIDEVQIPSGTGVKFDDLKRNEKYIFEIKTPRGRFWINAT